MQQDVLGGAPSLTYLRYNVELTVEALRDIGFACTSAELAAIRDMAEVRYVSRLDELGGHAAAAVDPSHFPATFDPTPAATGHSETHAPDEAGGSE